MVTAQRCEEQRKVLDPRRLMEEAKKTAGLVDFGDESFRDSMARLLDRAAREVELTDKGLQIYHDDVIRILVNRLRVQDAITKHPEILREDVSDPIVVIGMPRTGTTKLQRMMSAAPDVQKLYMWRMRNPAPFPDAVEGERDPRMGLARPEDTAASADEKTRAIHAAALAGHESAISKVEEETVLFDFVLDESVVGWNTQVPLFNYQDWAPGGPDREADRRGYRYVKTLLQYLQWQDGGKRNRPWIMKAIHHIAHMDTLLECFPQATLIHCHRDPRTTIASFSKLQWAVFSRKSIVDKEFIGREYFAWGAAEMRRYLEARKRLQLDGRILDVDYEDVRGNVMPAIREAYRRAGRELTPEAEQAMLQWEKENEQGKLGKHEYSLEEVGLTKEIVDSAFAEYIARFIRH